MGCASSPGSGAGSTGSTPWFCASAGPAAPTRPAVSATRPSRASSSTECASAVVAARGRSGRVASTVSPPLRVSTPSSSRGPSVPSLRQPPRPELLLGCPGCHLQVLRDHPRGSLPQGRPSRPQDELGRRPHPQAPRDEGSDLRWQEVQGSPWQGSQLHQVQALQARRLEEEQQGLAQALPLNLVVVAYAASNHPGGICCCCAYQHRLSRSFNTK